MLERILVPMDGSAAAEAVVKHLRPLLSAKDAEVILAQVVPVLPAFEGAWGDAPQALSALQDQAETYLGGWRDRLQEQGVRVKSVVRVGFPAETLLQLAESEKATLIALTTHGRTGLKRWTFGSVAEKILRASPVPVLVVRSFRPGAAGPEPAPEEPLAIRHVLVCVDGSDLSLEVVPGPCGGARALEARATLVNVLEDHLAYGPPVPQMNRAYELFRAAGVPVEPVMRRGDPATEILDACAEQKADLIAIATHGRGGLRRWALGSVAERVLRASTAPLLIVRSGRSRT